MDRQIYARTGFIKRTGGTKHKTLVDGSDAVIPVLSQADKYKKTMVQGGLRYEYLPSRVKVWHVFLVEATFAIWITDYKARRRTIAQIILASH